MTSERPGPVRRLLRLCLCLQFLGVPSLCLGPAHAADTPPIAPQEITGSRVALVIGQSDYRASPLPSATADAAVIASNLEEAGFDVESGVDLPEYGIGEKLSSFIQKISLYGADTTGIVYISGRFAQINGENLLLPVSVDIRRASDAALYSFNIQKLLSALASVPMKACVIMIDASAPPESLAAEKTFSPGLAIVDPPKGFLLSYSQNPGMPLINPLGKTGEFAKAFLEVLQQPTDSFSVFFKIIRVRIYEETGGTQRTWEADKLIDPSFSFFTKKDSATQSAPFVDLSDHAVQVSPLPPQEAYKRAIALDTIQSYQSFIKTFPDDEALPNIQYNLAVRREAEVWAGVLRLDTAEAYWTYINAYPDGGNVGVARERLARLGQPAIQPGIFAPVGFDDIPPPLASGEIIASSASMPIAFLPRPPSMRLPVVPVAVVVALAAAAAIPVVSGQGARAIPTMGAVSIHPAWAAPVSVNPSGSSRHAVSPFASGIPRTATVVARPASAVQPVSPLTAGSIIPSFNPPGASQTVRSLTPVAASPLHPAAAAPPTVVPVPAASGVKQLGAIALTAPKPFAGVQRVGATPPLGQVSQPSVPAPATPVLLQPGGRPTGSRPETSLSSTRPATSPMVMPALQMAVSPPLQQRVATPAYQMAPPAPPQQHVATSTPTSLQQRKATPAYPAPPAMLRTPLATPSPPSRKCPPNGKNC